MTINNIPNDNIPNKKINKKSNKMLKIYSLQKALYDIIISDTLSIEQKIRLSALAINIISFKYDKYV